jgi:hypothetical protein
MRGQGRPRYRVGGEGRRPTVASGAPRGRITRAQSAHNRQEAPAIPSSLTPDDYDLALRDLEGKLEAFIQRGEGSRRALRREAEDALSLRDEFPQVYARHPGIEGLVAELLAREQQERYMSFNAPREAPGCLLGWLVRRRKGGA